MLASHGGGGGGEYCVVVGIDETTRVVTLADVNPQIYFRHFSIPLKLLHQGVASRDPISMRERGIITIRRAPMPDAFRYDKGRNLNMLKVPSAHPFKTPTAAHLSAISFALTALGDPCSPEEIFYTAFTVLAGARYRRGSAIFPWQQLKISLHDLKERLTVEAVAKMVSKFQQSVGHELRGEKCIAQSPEDFRSGVIASVAPDAAKLLMVVYRVEPVHDMKLETSDAGWMVGCGLIKDFAPSTNIVTVADSNPTRYGDYWQCHIDKLYDATDLAAKEQEENGIVIIQKMTGSTPMTSPEAAAKAKDADPVEFGKVDAFGGQ